jgi:acyl carrier protein
MVPAAFVLLPALPVTRSGKVDRNALKSAPLPETDLAQGTGEAYAAPRTSLEEEIAEIWGEVLAPVSRSGAPRIGIHDNFFDLGGHSLLATQIVSRLRARYPVDLPLRRLFEAPTVAGLAALIEEALLSQQSEDELAALLAELDGLDEDVA